MASNVIFPGGSDTMICIESHILELWADGGKFDSTSKAAIDSLTDADVLDKINNSPQSGLTGRPISFGR